MNENVPECSVRCYQDQMTTKTFDMVIISLSLLISKTVLDLNESKAV
jgi:hypothetical protein